MQRLIELYQLETFRTSQRRLQNFDLLFICAREEHADLSKLHRERQPQDLEVYLELSTESDSYMSTL